MLQLEMPHINVLSNTDLLSQYEELGESSSSSDRKLTLTTLVQPIDFNPDFYTEVQDLIYLETILNASLPSRYAVLNLVMISRVGDFILVGFETLAVEDKNSMLHLTHVIGRVNGYVFVRPPDAHLPPGTIDEYSPLPLDPFRLRGAMYGMSKSGALVIGIYTRPTRERSGGRKERC
jgi:hypothetical protein